MIQLDRCNLSSRCEKTSFGELVYFGILTVLACPVSPFMIAHIVKALQVFLHSVWIQDVLDRATRISHRSRDIPKVAGKGTNQN